MSNQPHANDTAGAAPRNRSWLLLPAGLLMLALAAGVGWLLYRSGSAPDKDRTAVGANGSTAADTGKAGGTARPASPGTQSPAPRPATAESVATSPPALPSQGPSDPSGNPPGSSAASGSASTPGAPGIAPTGNRPPFSPAAVADLLMAARAAEWTLSASASPQVAIIDKDYLRFKLRSQRDGYLYIFMLGSDARDWWLLFPNGLDKNNRVTAGTELSLPRRSWPVQAGGPPGTTRFLAMVSTAPRDFSAAGLRESPEFGKFDLSAAAAAYENAPDPVVLFAGELRCAAVRSPCEPAYGAEQFQIVEEAAVAGPKKREARRTD